MTPLYPFTWLHEEAARIRYGSVDVRLKISGGKIVNVETLPGTERRSRSLQDVVGEARRVME